MSKPLGKYKCCFITLLGRDPTSPPARVEDTVSRGKSKGHKAAVCETVANVHILLHLMTKKRYTSE